MPNERLDAFARALADARRTGQLLPSWPEDALPQSVAEAYAVQDAVGAESGEARGGWKIGCTSEGSQRHLGSDGPIIGPMPAQRIFASGERVAAPGDSFMIEAEFAFRLERDLPPRDTDYGREEVVAALRSLHPAIEVVQGRFQDPRPSILSIISDDAGAGALILGAPVADWRDADLPAQAVEIRDGDAVLRAGHGRDVLGDPVDAMVWAANFLSGRGIGLRAGEVVTTGTCSPPAFVPAGRPIVADFGTLGQCVVTFATIGDG